MDRIFVNAGGTYGFMAEGQALRKITLADGTNVTLTTDTEYTALCYGGDTVLYGATNDELVSINQSNGARTILMKLAGEIDNILYKDTDELWVTVGNSFKLIDITQDTATADAVLDTGALDSVTITNDGYYYDGFTPDVTIASTSGAGATGVAVMSGNNVASVTVTAGGADYAAATVAFSTGHVGEAPTYVKQDL